MLIDMPIDMKQELTEIVRILAEYNSDVEEDILLFWRTTLTAGLAHRRAWMEVCPAGCCPSNSSGIEPNVVRTDSVVVSRQSSILGPRITIGMDDTSEEAEEDLGVELRPRARVGDAVVVACCFSSWN